MSRPIKQFSPEHLECVTESCVKDRCTESDHFHSAVKGHALFLHYLFLVLTVLYVMLQIKAKVVPSVHSKTNTMSLWGSGTAGYSSPSTLRLQVVQRASWSALTVSWLIFLLGWTFLFMSGVKPKWAQWVFPLGCRGEHVSCR